MDTKTLQGKEILITATALLLVCSCGGAQEETGQTAQHDTIGEYQVCTELYPADDPDRVVFEYTDDKITMKNEGIVLDSTEEGFSNQDVAEIAGDLYWRWGGNILKVMFIEGDSAVMRKVMTAAKKWERHCAVRFVFGSFVDPDVTIAFQPGGSWSYIGSYCQVKRPSMNLGWLKSTTNDAEYDRVVLHEFGHAMGFIHEHQQPNAEFQWNEDTVYAYYRRSQRPPWGRDKVYRNIFQKYKFSQVNATQYDSLSIMLYSFPKEFTLNGRGTSWNTALSAMDIAFANTWFPQQP